MSLTSPGLHPINVPTDLGARLELLFCLDGTPRTLADLTELVRARWFKSLRDPRLIQHFRAIRTGTEIFGAVSYETSHKVKAESGKEAYTACALDAIIEGFFLPIEIESTCFHCGQPIRIRMSNGVVSYAEPWSVMVWLGTSKGGACTCETDACPYINFFSSLEHANDWKDKNPNELGMPLTLQQSLELARKGWWEPIGLALENAKELTIRLENSVVGRSSL